MNIREKQYDIGFLVAMDEEVTNLLRQDPYLLEEFEEQVARKEFDNVEDAIQAHISNAECIGNTRFLTLTLICVIDEQNVEVDCLIAMMGIGKVNAAMATTLVCSQFKVDYLINYGFAGAVSHVPADTIFVADSVSYGDVDVRGFDYAFGQVPKDEIYYPMPARFTSQLVKDYSRLTSRVRYGRIITTDMFINDTKVKNQILANVREAQRITNSTSELLGFDMECAAVAQVARHFKKSLLIFKQVSDAADETAQDTFHDAAYESGSSALQNAISFIFISLPRIVRGIYLKRQKEAERLAANNE